jgi:hypothetical protein
MATTFKQLVSIVVWVLFIFGVLSLLGGFARMFMGAGLDIVRDYLGFGIGSLFLSVVTIRIRQKMD